MDFVAKVTNPSGPDYVPPEERIATFDNDGTLWCERPLPQGAFIMQRLAEMAEKDPSLRNTQPWQAACEGHFSWVGEATTKAHKGDPGDMTLLVNSTVKAFGEMTVEAYAALATAYYKSARHPQYHVSYSELAYQPMVELLAYLEANGFTTYIVSGGGRDFMRPITRQIYGIPAERVLGTSTRLSFKADDQGAPGVLFWPPVTPTAILPCCSLRGKKTVPACACLWSTMMPGASSATQPGRRKR